MLPIGPYSKQAVKRSMANKHCSGIGFEGVPDFDRVNAKCGVPVSQYFWHDYIHTTYPTQNAVAAVMVEDCMGAKRKRYCS